MRVFVDGSISFPAYLRDIGSGEVWEFRNAPELQALETDEELTNVTFDGCDAGRYRLDIQRQPGKIHVTRTGEIIGDSQFAAWVEVAVW